MYSGFAIWLQAFTTFSWQYRIRSTPAYFMVPANPVLTSCGLLICHHTLRSDLLPPCDLDSRPNPLTYNSLDLFVGIKNQFAITAKPIPQSTANQPLPSDHPSKRGTRLSLSLLVPYHKPRHQARNPVAIVL